ncbi:MAG: amino acid dehydrogenase, partial [Hydrocarboniphaga effusa]|nr:amino acid dehydrogenase [Hydrocarboniphaga effusa]
DKSVAAGRSGDPSPATALGVFIGIQACARWKLNRSELKGLRVAIQGAGNVGYRLAQGGGKSVILGDPRHEKTEAKMRAMGRFVNTLNGQYIVAEDSGTNVADIRLMALETTHVGGLADDKSVAAGRSGDPSPATALGVFIGIQACVRWKLNRGELKGLRVAIQGAGNVGYRLAQYLHQAGAKLWVTDLHAPAVERCVKEFGATAVPMDAVFGLDVDVFAPCALGAILGDRSIPQLKAVIVAGSANNQLAEARHDRALLERGILYAPDYVINAGGVIDIYYEGPGYSEARVKAHLERIGATLTAVFERSKKEKRPTGEIANRMAEDKFKR